MAHIHPGRPELLLPASGRAAELQTLQQLARALPNEYTVYHSVHFGLTQGRWQRFGEIDFLIVNQSGDILLIEQKNGSLIECEDGLAKAYGEREKPVVKQMHRARDAVLGDLTEIWGGPPPLGVNLLLYCPDHRIVRAEVAGIPAGAIVDASQRGHLAEHVQRILGPGNPAQADTASRVRNWAAQVLSLEPDMEHALEWQQQTYVRMAGGLVELIDGLEARPWRLRIRAAAGAGKSLAAAHMFRRAKALGRRPLLLCYNRPLADALQSRLGDNVNISTFHHWCRTMLEVGGGRFDEQRAATEARTYWPAVIEEIMDRAPERPRYDTLIIDEGQDFEDEWWSLVSMFAAGDDWHALWLEDPEQAIYQRAPTELPDFITYNARVCYRTPQRIGRYIRRLLGSDIDWRSPFEGVAPNVSEYRDDDEQLELIEQRVRHLINAGFTPDQIRLVSLRGVSRACFAGLDRIGAFTLRRFTGQYDADGTTQQTTGDLAADSIYRFKGQAAPAIILVDADMTGDDEGKESRLIYCALTRASVACEILVSSASPWRARFQKAL